MAQYIPQNISSLTNGAGLFTIIEQWAEASRTLQSGNQPPTFAAAGTLWRRPGANNQPVFMSKGDNRLSNQIPVFMPNVSTDVAATAISKDLSSYVVALDNSTIDVHATGGMIVPHGTEDQRTTHNFRLRGNTDSDELEVRIEGVERTVFSGTGTLSERITSDVNRRLVAGDNITITRSTMTNSITISGQATGGGANVTVSSSPPASPSNGDLWFDSDGSGGLALYYEPDTAWVGTSQAGIVGSLTDLNNVSGTWQDNQVVAYSSATGLFGPAGGGSGQTKVTKSAGATVEFTGIPTGVEKVTILMSETRTGHGHTYIQLGTTDYPDSGYDHNANTISRTNQNSFNEIQTVSNPGEYIGLFTLRKGASNEWIISGQSMRVGVAQFTNYVGRVSLSGDLQRIRMKNDSTTPTGNWTIFY